MAAPNGMAPQVLSNDQIANILKLGGPAAQAHYQSLPVPDRQPYLISIVNVWKAAQANGQQQRAQAQQQQAAGSSIPQQQQQQQQFNQRPPQQQQVRPPIDLNALAQAQNLIKAHQQQQSNQRLQGPQARPEGMPINLNYTPEQVQNMQSTNPQLSQLLRQVQASGQLGQLPPGVLQQTSQLIQAQQMQAQNHIPVQQSPHMGQMPMPRTPNQAQLSMQRHGSAQGGAMQHPSSPATFSSPQVNQQSPLQGTPQHHNVPLGAAGQMQQRPNPPPGVTAQQIEAYKMAQSQAMRAQSSQPGQQRPLMRPPMQAQQQQQLQQQAFAAARNGQMVANGQMQGMQIRPNRPPLQTLQGFNAGPPGPVVNQIVDNLQTLSQMRDQDELDQAQKEALNTVISNPAVLQSAFLGRAAQAKEDRLSEISAELGRVQGNQGSQGSQGSQGNQLGAQQMAQLQAMMNNPQLSAEQRQVMMQHIAQGSLHLPQQLSAEELARRNQAGGALGNAGQAAGQGASSNASVPSPATAGHNRQGSIGSTGSRPGGQPGGGENQPQVLFAKMHQMPEERREQIYQKNPGLRNWYKRQMELYLQRAHESRIESEVAQAQAQIGNNSAMQGQLQNQQMPLPNLQLPLNRARGLSQQGNGMPLSGNAAVAQAAAVAQNAQQNAMAQQQLQAVAAQAQTALQQQQNNVAQSQSQSPNPQGTPLHRANGSFSGPRGSTPALQAAMAANNAAMGQRPSPQMRQGGLAGTPPGGPNGIATQMDLQMRMQGNMPGNAAPGQGGMQTRPATPNIPHGFQKIQLHSMIIPDKLSLTESTSLPFPNSEGPRPTLSVGLGSGPVTGLPVLEHRPAAFDDLINATKSKVPRKTAPHGPFWRKPKSHQAVDEDGEAELDEEDGEADGAADVAAVAKPAVARPLSPAIKARTSRKRTISEIAKNVDKELLLTETSEDFLLELADEFLESVAEAGCRLAKLRKGNRLEVKDLQVHLERDSNIFIPGFAYEAILVDRAPFLRKNPPIPTRAARLAAVQQAKRDGAPINKAPAKHAQASAA